MGKKKDKMKKMPQQIFVAVRKDIDEEYLEAYVSLLNKSKASYFDDGEYVGIYELVDVKKVKSQTTLE